VTAAEAELMAALEAELGVAVVGVRFTGFDPQPVARP
jgi:hypothetical protein